MGKATKTSFSLGSPYADPAWPAIKQQDEKSILDLLCSLLAPIGDHRRRHVTPSKGKREKKRKRLGPETSKATPTQQTLPPPPELASHITVGFNSTTRSLCPSQVIPSTKLDSATVLASTENGKTPTKCQSLAAVFVDRSSVPEVMWSQMPLLAHAAANKQPSGIRTRLLPLPSGSEARLIAALGIPRVGILGVCKDAPGAKPLLDFVLKSVPPIEIPWAKDVQSGVYLPVKIDVLTTEVASKVPRGDPSLQPKAVKPVVKS